MSQPIECSSCMAEAPHDEATDSFDLDDWNLEGEYGILCPTCNAEQGEPSGPSCVILDEKSKEAIAKLTEVDKVEEPTKE